MKILESSMTNMTRRSFLQSLTLVSILSFSDLGKTYASKLVKPFSFAYITDVHLSTGLADSNYKMLQESQIFLQETIKQLNALKPDFVVFGGDQVESVGTKESNWQLFIDLIQGLHMPWYFVLGEQDILNFSKNNLDKWKIFGLDIKGRGIQTSETYWSIDPVENVHLIGLDSSLTESKQGHIDAKQLDWLKKDLEQNRNKFTILICHHPLLAPPPYDGGTLLDEYVVNNGADLREILGNNPEVRLVLSGHLFLNKVQLERNIFHISNSALSVYPCQYKIFKISQNEMIMESHSVPFPALIKKARRILTASSLSSRYREADVIEICEGQEIDNNAKLSYYGKSFIGISKKQLKSIEKDFDKKLESTEINDKIKEPSKNNKKINENEQNKKNSENNKADEKVIEKKSKIKFFRFKSKV